MKSTRGTWRWSALPLLSFLLAGSLPVRASHPGTRLVRTAPSSEELWLLRRGVRRHVPSSRVLERATNFTHASQVDVIAPEELLRIPLASPLVEPARSDAGRPWWRRTLLLDNPAPITTSHGMQFGHTFAQGSRSSLSFWLYLWHAPDGLGGERSIFHATPLRPSVVAPALFIGLPVHPTRLFLGLPIARDKLQGTFLPFDIVPRAWHHIVVTFNNETLTLRVNGSMATAVATKTATCGLNGRTLARENALHIGRSRYFHGVTGLIAGIEAYEGVALSADQARHTYATQLAEKIGRFQAAAMPPWMIRVAHVMSAQREKLLKEKPHQRQAQAVQKGQEGQEEQDSEGKNDVAAAASAAAAATPAPASGDASSPSGSGARDSYDGVDDAESAANDVSLFDLGVALAAVDDESGAQQRQEVLAALKKRASRWERRSLRRRRVVVAETAGLIFANFTKDRFGGVGQQGCHVRNQGWWSYEWCHLRGITQFHRDLRTGVRETAYSLGTYIGGSFQPAAGAAVATAADASSDNSGVEEDGNNHAAAGASAGRGAASMPAPLPATTAAAAAAAHSDGETLGAPGPDVAEYVVEYKGGIFARTSPSPEGHPVRILRKGTRVRIQRQLLAHGWGSVQTTPQLENMFVRLSGDDGTVFLKLAPSSTYSDTGVGGSSTGDSSNDSSSGARHVSVGGVGQVATDSILRDPSTHEHQCFGSLGLHVH